VCKRRKWHRLSQPDPVSNVAIKSNPASRNRPRAAPAFRGFAGLCFLIVKTLRPTPANKKALGQSLRASAAGKLK